MRATKGWSAGAVSPCLVSNCTMGYTVVTRASDGHEYRYTEWAAFNTEPANGHQPDWTALVGSEMYNHSADKGENENIWQTAPQELRSALSRMLHKGPSAT